MFTSSCVSDQPRNGILNKLQLLQKIVSDAMQYCVAVVQTTGNARLDQRPSGIDCQ